MGFAKSRTDNMKVIVFDLGGTLMEYKGMPLSWLPYYSQGFAAVDNAFSLELTQEEINRSVQILKDYNPRYCPREVEIPPEIIFGDATRHWRRTVTVEQVISAFFSGLNLVPHIYEDSLPGLFQLREMGYQLACLTNLPSGMPDALFRGGLERLTGQLDVYLSSGICGFRKPNEAGLCQIAQKLQVPLESLLFVGDETLDEETARRAGCRFLKMNRGRKPTRQDQRNFVNDLGELVGMLAGMPLTSPG